MYDIIWAAVNESATLNRHGEYSCNSAVQTSTRLLCTLYHRSTFVMLAKNKTKWSLYIYIICGGAGMAVLRWATGPDNSQPAGKCVCSNRCHR